MGIDSQMAGVWGAVPPDAEPISAVKCFEALKIFLVKL